MSRTMEEVERMLAELRADVEALKTEPSNVWPEDSDTVHVLRTDGSVERVIWNGLKNQRGALRRGRCFYTLEEAEAADAQAIILAGIHADARADRERIARQGYVRVIINAESTLLVPLEEVPYGTPYFHTSAAAAASAKKRLGGEE